MAKLEPGSLQLKVTLEGMPDLNTVLTDEIRFWNPDTDEYETREKTLGDLVAEKMVEQLMATDPWSSLRKNINDLRDQIIREKVEPVIEAALEGPVQLTNTYGEPKGQPVTLRQLVIDEAVKELSRPKRTTHGSGSETLLGKVLREQCGAVLTKELTEAVAAGKKEVVDAIRKRAAEFLTDKVLETKTR